jgi:intracellular sulfur oxidation DsrE/DsrF family protein
MSETSHTDAPGLLLHAGPGSDLAAALRSAAHAVEALGRGAAVEVIVQGPGVKDLTHGTGLTAALEGLLHDGVKIIACENSMRGAGVPAEQLATGIGTVPAAVAHLARRQWQGWAYIRL